MAGHMQNAERPTSPDADPQGEPFLLTRFAVPTRPATFLPRRRLTRHLDQALLTSLTMVNGAAGAGKTLLVADWVAGRDEPVAWLTAEGTGRGPGILWAYLLQALGVAGVQMPPDIGCPADANRVDRTLLARVAAHLGARTEPVIVVLDEYDRVTDPRIAEQLEFVLHHAGRGMRLVLVTRTEPLLPLHRYRAAGEMTEIRGAELAFTPEEAAALLELHGLSLPVDAARALVERTQGWAAGLRLCALAAQERPDAERYLKEFESDRTTVADFLLAEVLKRQPPETQDLLLRISVLDRFCPDLVNALTGRTDAEAVLVGLHRDNAFVEHLGHAWYRLHPLFKEILQAHLRVRSPGLRPELHLRAAHWLRRSGSLEQTLGHGAAAGDWEFTAGALVDDLAIGQLFTGRRSDDLAELFAGMGPDAASPAADIVRAARELAGSDLDRGLNHLHRAESNLGREDAGDQSAARLSCALLEALVARLTGSPDRAEMAAAMARHVRTDVPSGLLDRHPELTALLLTHLGSTRLWAGRFDDARAALVPAAGAPGGVSTALPRGDSLGRLALIDYLDGRLGRAERKAQEAITATQRFGVPQPSGCGIGRLVLAAVAVDRDELDRAQTLLDSVPLSPAPMRDPVTEAGRAIATARLLLARGKTRAAVEAAEPAVSAEVASPWASGHTALITSAAHLAEGRPETAARLLRAVPGDQVACAVEAARAHLAAGEPGAAIALLDTVRPEARTGPGLTVRAMLVRAQAADRAGDPAAARRQLAQALREARREKLRRPFLDAGAWLHPLLSASPLRELAEGWLAPRSVPPGGTPRSPDQPPPVVEELSGREHDVLRRLAQMMSTEEIADDLHVSVNTVKTHLKGVYRKLAVSRRTDAVRRARELRLL
ncbi:helix-turn-helix transcriptional regulator [Streptomyces agglomeratus]|uniref:Helix-turn-helix transcriptional regulator n=1 Tax=Streptomyces agglomeratus TaxID=285458 RepID=A0A1E5PGU9_9ACTN|nr:LuxR C-terminal-related transcriptional regulator [Streptomyces agglomeratus]OEJ28614.1 helix-turn-helix transcriptional regulator [Streptomyces agglomeratus]OEJ37322.1 helix-turn-helix transcriptional regulator [Streptomyces agglomeratus]OEJ48297.1 helix-turn-helix transcriptional regulator [Streptomyces agglomeratus]OEJ49866.1 helix-turn-helix transcriptional regulator [Streptomyces agglomeratus]